MVGLKVDQTAGLWAESKADDLVVQMADLMAERRAEKMAVLKVDCWVGWMVAMKVDVLVVMKAAHSVDSSDYLMVGK